MEEACETSWLGNTCGELAQGAKKYGLETEEIEHITPEYLLAILKQNSPLIALIDPAVLYGGLEGFGHFVVITGLEGDKIYYNDPGIDRNLTKEVSAFIKAWKKFSLKGVKIWKSMKR